MVHMLLFKIPQFLPSDYETRTNSSTYAQVSLSYGENCGFLNKSILTVDPRAGV